jgi:hypothetical protein
MQVFNVASAVHFAAFCPLKFVVDPESRIVVFLPAAHLLSFFCFQLG